MGSEEEQQKAYLVEVTRRLTCALNHYFSAECDIRCPCYTPDRFIDIHDITNNEDNELVGLPNEILCIINGYLTTKDFIVFNSSCKRLYAHSGDDHYSGHYEHRRKKKAYLTVEATQRTDLIPRIARAKAILRHVITTVPTYAHDLHTCYNESINGCRTRHLPKSKTFPSTCLGRSMWARLQFNLGGGAAKKLAYEALDLAPSHQAARMWVDLDQRRLNDRKRQASPDFKVGAFERLKKRARLVQEEKRVSKQRGDEYYEQINKSALPHTAKVSYIFSH